MSTLTNSLKQRLRDGDEPLYGLWLSLGKWAAAIARNCDATSRLSFGACSMSMQSQS